MLPGSHSRVGPYSARPRKDGHQRTFYSYSESKVVVVGALSVSVVLGVVPRGPSRSSRSFVARGV